MGQFLKFGILYFICSVALAFLFRDNAADTLENVLRLMVNGSIVLIFLAFGLFCIGLAISAVKPFKDRRRMFLDTLQATLATVYFQAGFIVLKTSMPFIVPFYADPIFAKIDAFLSFGVDPWIITHTLGSAALVDTIAGIYLLGWIWPAMLFPIILATLDNNSQRIRSMLILYITSWVLIGNVLALAGMSAGPIYYDRIYGDTIFENLANSFHPLGPNMQAIRTTQESLWFAYTELAQSKGSGISAFPSVHVSVATLVSIYLVERSIYLLPVAFVGLLAIFFMSIYSGYHYAIDGYVSFIVIVGLWIGLRFRKA